jgi:hypothetical protein
MAKKALHLEDITGEIIAESNTVFSENDQVITSNYTLMMGKNAMSVGPIALANNIAVTISDGSILAVI